VGAGFGGIAMAVNLAKAGIQDFTVFEAASGAGGVWWHNTYPGCQVDTESRAYSFSFVRYDWPATHGRQEELRRYADYVIDHFCLRGHFQFNTRVTEAVWIEDRQKYRVQFANGDLE